MEITGVNQAVKEYEQWIAQDHFRVAKIMLDVSDGEVWCDVFLNCNEWKEYHSDTIINLSAMIIQAGDQISVETVADYAVRYTTPMSSDDDLIPIVEYAEMHGRNPDTIKQRAQRGSFKTAQKIGRNWVIDRNEPLIDNRKSQK